MIKKLLFLLLIGFSANAQPYTPIYSDNAQDTRYDAFMGVRWKYPGAPMLDSLAVYGHENGFEFRRLKPLNEFAGSGMSYNSTTNTFDANDISDTNEIEVAAQSGNSGKLLTTNGSATSWVSVKQSVPYSGTTNSSGIYAVTFPVAYSVAPNIQANVINGSNKQTIIPTVTTTGFSCYVQLRADVLGLLPTYSNVNGAEIDVIVTSK